MANPGQSGSAKMRPRARLISLIGDELISDEPVAIVELVKNSYDADATKVEIVFEGKDPFRPDRIIVRDNGIGMDLDTVLGCWFEPGTISKRKDQRSPGGRLYLGAKGIGRFAAARLAESLILETRKNKSKDEVFVIINWGVFNDPKVDRYLDEIELDYEVRKTDGSSHGTILTLETLRKKVWKEADFEHLRARLTRLISPFREVSDFSIVLNIPGFPQHSGVVEPPELILQPRYLLEGKLNSNGTFTGEIKLDGKSQKSFSSHRIGHENTKLSCGPFDIEVRAWDRDREGLDPLKNTLSMGIREIRNTLNNYCGVSIYRDGFRIHPYGEQGNDWLNLDNRSRQNPATNLANNQIIAAIRISRENNPNLRDRSTREGMVLNEEYYALEKWFKNILHLLEEERYRVRPRRKEEDRIEPLFESLDISPAAKTARKELGKDHPVSVLISETEKQVHAGIERIQEVFSRLLMASGLGQMIDIVIHEIGSPLGKINRQITVIERDMEKHCDPERRELFSPKIETIKAWLEQIHNLRGRLDPQTPAKRGRATTFNVHEEIEDNFNLYQALLEKQKIKWTIHPRNKPVAVKMSRAGLGQIIANLIDNSIYWIMDEKGSGNGGEIDVRIEKLEHGFQILYSDDGPGVPDEDQSRIFEPYFSTKRGGSGMGLGLYICRLIVEPYGKIVYRDDIGKLAGACFEISFERRVGP